MGRVNTRTASEPSNDNAPASDETAGSSRCHQKCGPNFPPPSTSYAPAIQLASVNFDDSDVEIADYTRER